MQQRYYDPVVGRFYGNDPVGYVTSSPVHSFGRYTYSNNNPYKYIDPDGQFAFLIPLAIFIVKEVAAEVASQATGGATDFLSVRRMGKKAVTAIAKKISKGKGNCSFTHETLILTKSGYKSIVEVKVGDIVLSKNDKTEDVAWRTVSDTFKDWHEKTITFTVVDENGVEESITTTPEHPFYLANQGWLPAGQVAVGTIFEGPISSDKISVVGIEINQEPQYAYNFTVDIDHTYFVGKTNVWVHNSCPFTKGVNAKSVKQFGHTFKTHGAGNKNTNKLKGRAAGTGQSQGQFLDNDKAAEFLAGHKGITEPTTVDLPSGLGQVISPNGTITEATKVLIVPKKGGGFKTAYPVEEK